jgi:hypothetical protein
LLKANHDDRVYKREDTILVILNASIRIRLVCL